MSATFAYNFQPQPPPHPKTAGGKLGSLVPILATSSLSGEDSGSHSDYTSSIPFRLTSIDVLTTRPKTKTSIVSLSNFPSPHNNITHKRPGLTILPSSQTLSNNINSVTLNLNQVTPSLCINNSLQTTLVSVPNSSSSGFNLINIKEKDLLCSTTTDNIIPCSTSSGHFPSSALSEPNSTSHSTNCQPYSNNTAHLSDHSITSTDISSDDNNVSATTTAHLSNHSITSTDISSDDNNVSATTTAYIPTTTDVPAESPTSPADPSLGSLSNFAYEHDHDYESVGSPCSSTASGPIYVRPTGFTHHAQEIEVPHGKSKQKKKKYLTSLVTVREGYKKREATPPKLKPKREPLPMKLRALPQSFWQQPNVAHQVSPATLFLPPLSNKDSEEILMDVLPATPPEEKDAPKKSHVSERKVIVTNTDLLFKLFDGIGEGKKTTNSFKSRAVKVRKLIPKSNTKGLLLGNDPYMVDAVSEKVFPQLTLEGSRNCSGGGNTSLQLITLKEGDRTVTFPSLSFEQNYPQMLSELVLHI